jgi:hypothetical protein
VAIPFFSGKRKNKTGTGMFLRGGGGWGVKKIFRWFGSGCSGFGSGSGTNPDKGSESRVMVKSNCSVAVMRKKDLFIFWAVMF